jgi:hypothetical protein
LGAVLNVPTLTTDSALNVLCLHFDPYAATDTCTLRLAPGGAGLD